MVFPKIFSSLFKFVFSNSSPTYRGNHQIDVGDFLLEYVKSVYNVKRNNINY